MKKVVVRILIVAVVVAAIVVVLMVGGVKTGTPPSVPSASSPTGADARGIVRPTDERTAPVGRGVPDAHDSSDRFAAASPVDTQSQEDEASSEDDSDSEENEEPQTEEEKREAAEEKAVNDFDDLTDKWQEASEKGVAMSDIDHFAKLFRGVPKERQDECIHRALNLIPDENVMLLAGILMDKSMDKDIVETVFNDILNRDEDVKTPILRQIFRDKTHPCWADTAWILDATDGSELPGAI